MGKPAGLVSELRRGSSVDGWMVFLFASCLSSAPDSLGDVGTVCPTSTLLWCSQLMEKKCQGFFLVCVFFCSFYATHIEHPSVVQQDTKEPLCHNETQPYGSASLITISSGAIMSHTIQSCSTPS